VQGLLKGSAELRLELLSLGLAASSVGNGQEITVADQARVNPGSSPFSSTIRLKASVGKPGIYAFKVRGVLEGISTGSIVKPFPNPTEERLVYVEAVETLRRIQILALAPHPDLGVLRQTLEETLNYRVELIYGLQGLEQAAKEGLADLYILHQWPSVDAGSARNPWLEQIYKQGKPLWFLGGARSQWASWPGNVQSQNASVSSNSVSPALNKSWNAFAISIHSERPLWTIDYQTNPSRAYLWGEGLWRWRLASMNSEESTKINSDKRPLAVHERLILQTVSLLLSGRESDRFEARPVQAVFNETENVVFEASSRNASGEFENSPSLELQISSANKVLYKGTMNPSGMGYSLGAGRWAPGTYQYTATLTRNGIAAVRKGTFAVSPYDLESGSGLANQSLMNQLSTLHGGLARQAKSPDRTSNGSGSMSNLDHALDDFAKHIFDNPVIKPSSY
ncbi:MAG: hypothetical protein EBS08_06600, partial [Cytophagia bacterium]|nr:hypothetical protein [Cytophagia bacterium]